MKPDSRAWRAALATLILAVVSPRAASTQDAAVQRGAADRAQQIEAQAAQNPNPALLWFLAEARLAAGDRAGAAEALTRLADRNAGFAPPRRSVFQDHAADDVLGPVIARMRREAAGPGVEAAVTVRHPGLVPEGLARDPRTGRLLIGDMAGRRILAVDADGAVSTFADGLDLRPLGMAVEPGTRHLWVATTDAFWDSPVRRGALLAFDLDTGHLMKTIGPGEAQSLNDLSFTPDGDLYLSDPAGGALFILRKDGESLERVTPAGALQYPNGVAVSGDGLSIYVGQGLSLRRLNTATGALTPVAMPADLGLPYVDGLYWREGELLAILNSGMDRVVRLKLDSSGERIVSHQVLGAGPPLDAPTTGVIANGAFYVVGNAQIDRLRSDGEVIEPVAPIQILRFPL